MLFLKKEISVGWMSAEERGTGVEGFGFLYKLYNVCIHGIFQGSMRVGIFMMFRFKEHCVCVKG